MTILAFACFLLGWLVARSCGDEPAPRPGTGQRSPEIPILVDAGSIRLLPDAALRLEPIDPPAVDASVPR